MHIPKLGCQEDCIALKCYNCLTPKYFSQKQHAMASLDQQDLTRWLRAWSDGDRSALEKLVPAVYAELHRMAHHDMNQERPDHVLQTTALVNEAYIRLVDSRERHWRNRAHFLPFPPR